MQSLERNLVATIRRHAMIGRGDHVLVALSGGADSTALLQALVDWSRGRGVSLSVGHVNHRLRGAAADEDEQFCRELCSQLGVAVEVETLVGLAAGGNLEERARRARYRALTEIARRRGCTRIATAHTRDDQAETVVLRLLRGTGTQGLVGIVPRRGVIVRPLLDCTRAMVLDYLAANQLGYRDDASNRDPRFQRNRVRNEVLPMLRDLNPAIAAALARTADVARSDARALRRVYAAALNDLTVGDSGEVAVARLGALDRELRGGVVRHWLRRERGHLRAITAQHVAAVLRLCRRNLPSGRVELPGGATIERRYERLVFLTAAADANVTALELRIGAGQRSGGWEFEVQVLSSDRAETILADPWVFAADADQLTGTLAVRRIARGDRIVPFGMRQARKLQDVFVDRKVPRSLRWQRPVVTLDGEIVWVPGVIRFAGAALVATTRMVVRIRAQAPPDATWS